MTPPRLIQRQECPPGGFRFFVAETKMWLPTTRDPAPNINDLYQQVLSHYRANRIPIPPRPQLEAFIEEQVCHRLIQQGIQGFCDFPDGPPDPKTIRHFKPFTHASVVAFTGTMWDWVKSGFEAVPIEEIKRRAAICAGCSHNRTPEGCTGCNAAPLQAVASIFAVGTRGPWDNALKSCDVCGCVLIAKTRIPVDILQRNMPQQQLDDLPGHCWLKPI